MREFEEKIKRLRNFLKEREFEGIVLGKSHNFSWITGGRDNFIAINTERGGGYLVVTQEEVIYFTNNIEAPRIREEEISSLPVEIREVKWWEDIMGEVKKVVGERKVASDGVAGEWEDVDGDLYELRTSLLPEEVERYFILGRECAESVERVLLGIKEGVREREVAGRVSEVLLARGIYPVVNMVASDERIEKFRHPLPTDKPLKKYLMSVVCGKREGLIVSLTRIVSLGKVDEEKKRKHLAVTYVDTVFISSTLPGEAMGEIFHKGITAYEEKGYPEEWKKHHQGGPTGYLTREFRVSREEKRKVSLRQPFAWNPSITGTKSEDTIISYPEAPLIVTFTPSWPKIKVEYGGRIWERPDILSL